MRTNVKVPSLANRCAVLCLVTVAGSLLACSAADSPSALGAGAEMSGVEGDASPGAETPVPGEANEQVGADSQRDDTNVGEADGTETVPDNRRPVDDGGVSLVPSPVSVGWQLNELAMIVDGRLELTPGIDDPNGHERGTAFWPMALASEGLQIEFDAEIIPIPQRFHGDGMTLVLADVAAGAKPTDFGDSGGGLGYTSAPCCVGIKGIAIVLDTSKNANDPSGNFLGVATGGQIDRVTWAVTKTDGVPTWVGTKNRIGVTVVGAALAVSINGNEVLRTTADSPTIPRQVLIGFTAANGSNKSRHLVTGFVVSRR